MENRNLSEAASLIDHQLLALYMEDMPNNSCPTDSRAFSWLAADMEMILMNTDVTMSELLDQIRSTKDGNRVLNHIDIAKINRSVEIRSDFAKALDGVEYGTHLSGALGWGFSQKDIEELAIIHKNDTVGKYREKIEDLLEDCNFHTECGDFADGKYDEYIRTPGKEEDMKNIGTDKKIAALAEYFGIAPERISKNNNENIYNTCMYLIDDNRFYVADEREADKLARAFILEDIWSFRPEFILDHSKALQEGGSQAVSAFKQMQEVMCENCTPIVKALIDDIDRFVKDAIAIEGRGHFISLYDGEEHEKNGIKIYFIDTDEIEKDLSEKEDFSEKGDR